MPSWVQIPPPAPHFIYKAYGFSPSDKFWDKVAKIRKFIEQEKLLQYREKLEEISSKEEYFSSKTALKILKIVVFFNRIQEIPVSYRILIQYYNPVYNEKLSPESIARIVRYLVKHGILFKIKNRPASFYAELSSGIQVEHRVRKK